MDDTKLTYKIHAVQDVFKCKFLPADFPRACTMELVVRVIFIRCALSISTEQKNSGVLIRSGSSEKIDNRDWTGTETGASGAGPDFAWWITRGSFHRISSTALFETIDGSNCNKIERQKRWYRPSFMNYGSSKAPCMLISAVQYRRFPAQTPINSNHTIPMLDHT